MTSTGTLIHHDSGKRHDFVLLFDVEDGNPNGDPDAGNLPRTDPETRHGLVTDVCLKRKVRNYVALAKPEEARYKIFIEESSVLNETIKRAWVDEKGKAPGAKTSKEDQKSVRDRMCREFFDIRLFGAVLSTGQSDSINCGQVRGPLQLTFSRSVDPVLAHDLSITRMAVTNIKDLEKERTMGRKALLPYGLYLGHGFFNPHFAKQTGADGADLELVWEALVNMFEQDRSASRGMMACRGLYVFTHDKPLGNAPAHKLFERVQVKLKNGVEAPRKFEDYDVDVDLDDLPGGISFWPGLD